MYDLELSVFNVSDYLDNEEVRYEYLKLFLNQDNPELLQKALKDIEESKTK